MESFIIGTLIGATIGFYIGVKLNKTIRHYC